MKFSHKIALISVNGGLDFCYTAVRFYLQEYIILPLFDIDWLGKGMFSGGK